MQIRRARADDATLIGELTVQAYRAGGHLNDGDPYEATLRDVASRIADTIVVERDGFIIGSVTTCGPAGPTAEISREGEWEFRFLAVHPDHWGSGVARGLIDACEQAARDADAQSMVISVIDINERGHQLYPRLGYVRAPERDWSPQSAHDQAVNLLVYRKSLTASAS
jgi:N-acetylglutamate synthase-like GNAT family acetyltransferase